MKGKYCIHCGKEVSETSAFCPYCGKQIGEASAKETNATEGSGIDTEALEIAAKKTLNRAKEIGKAMGEKGRSLGEAGLRAYQEEMASDWVNEYRIVKNVPVFAGILILATLFCLIALPVVLLNGLLGGVLAFLPAVRGNMLYLTKESLSLAALNFGFLFMPVLFLWISIVQVKKTYLRDYLLLFVINILMVLSGWLWGIENEAGLFSNLWYFLALCGAVVALVMFVKLLRKKNRKILLLVSLVAMAFFYLLAQFGNCWNYSRSINEAVKSGMEQRLYDYLSGDSYGYDDDYDEIDFWFFINFMDEYEDDLDEDFLDALAEEYVKSYGESEAVEKFLEKAELYAESGQEEYQEAKTAVNLLAMLPALAYFVILVLFILCISNVPGKKYSSREEPEEGYIGNKSIGLSVVRSIVTGGLFYLFWTYGVLSDIRKLSGERGSTLGEWLLYHIIPCYRWYWVYNRYQKLSIICDNNRTLNSGGATLFLILSILCLGMFDTIFIQGTMNEIAEVMDETFVYGIRIQPRQTVLVTEETESDGWRR